MTDIQSTIQETMTWQTLLDPQTIAVILSQFEPGKAAQVLANVSKERRAQILYRMATLEAVPEATFREIEEELSTELRALNREQDKRLS